MRTEVFTDFLRVVVFFGAAFLAVVAFAFVALGFLAGVFLAAGSLASAFGASLTSAGAFASSAGFTGSAFVPEKERLSGVHSDIVCLCTVVWL